VPPWFARIIAMTLHSSGQFAVRFVTLLLAGMLGLAHVFGLDTLLGAFAAAMVSVLTFPLLAFRLLRREAGRAGKGSPDRAAESGEAW